MEDHAIELICNIPAELDLRFRKFLSNSNTEFSDVDAAVVEALEDFLWLRHDEAHPANWTEGLIQRIWRPVHLTKPYSWLRAGHVDWRMER